MRFATHMLLLLAIAPASAATACDHLRALTGARTLTLFRDTILNAVYNRHKGTIDGHLWPPHASALSMAGQRRLDNFAALIATAVEDGVAGNVIEAGVWRGGASFVAAMTLELMGERAAGRNAYLADSFRGIPKQSGYVPASTDTGGVSLDFNDLNAHRLSILNDNSVKRVQADAKAVGLDTSRLRFVEGYFNDSLPALLRREPDVQFAVVRLDGDTYFSTYESVALLYPRLSDGGFIIIDDYLDWDSCRKAIHVYRKEHQISEPIIMVPHNTTRVHGTAKEQPRGAYWRKNPAAGQALCAGCPEGGLRPIGALLHQGHGSQPVYDAHGALARHNVSTCLSY